MGQPADHRATRNSLPAAIPAPRVRVPDPAFQHRTVSFESLTSDGKTELVNQTESVEIRGSERRLEHVEVFRVDGVGTSIFGRPRPLSSHRHAATLHPTTTPSNAKSHFGPSVDHSCEPHDDDNQTSKKPSQHRVVRNVFIGADCLARG